jgi:hypothetical protein
MRVDLEDDMTRLAQELNALPSEVRHIYVNNLGLPSTVANLMPVPDYEEWRSHPPAGGYYANYENRFGFGYGQIAKTQMATLDKHVAQVNDRVRQIFVDNFDDPSRLHFVDMAGLLQLHDAKHLAPPPERGVRMKDSRRFSNVMIEADPTGFARGGLMGLDGMHPTNVGYGLMAQRVVDCIAEHEGGPKRKVDLEAAYANDALLQNLPGIWSIALWVWRDYRRAQGVDPLQPEDGGNARKDMVEVMEACTRFKYT